MEAGGGTWVFFGWVCGEWKLLAPRRPGVTGSCLESFIEIWASSVPKCPMCERETLLTGRSFNPTLRQKILDALKNFRYNNDADDDILRM